MKVSSGGGIRRKSKCLECAEEEEEEEKGVYGCV